MGRILAAADIGSNTAHLLVAEVLPQGRLRRISDTNEWISLGEIVGRTGEIPPELVQRLEKCLGAFVRLSKLHNAEGLYVFGTEAVRKASNSAAVLKALQAATGVRVHLIDGQREAEIGLRGAWIDGEGPTPFSLAEVGGGSAQIAYCEAGPSIVREASLPLGTGALIARCGLVQPGGALQIGDLQALVREALEPIDFVAGERLLGCGGVARGLWRALHPDGDPWLRFEEIDYLLWAVGRLSGDQIGQRFQVKAKRAATLLPGAVVYREFMRRGGFESIQISRFGVREGAIMEMAEGKVKGWRP